MNKNFTISLLIIFLVSFLFSLPALSKEVSKEEVDEQRIKRTVKEVINELRLESTTQTEEQKAARTIYDDGFYLVGTDDTLKIGAWVQSDVRIFEKGHPGTTQFLIRRARLDIRGNLEYDFAYRLYGEFEGATAGSQNSANLKEGWIEYSHFPFLRIRVGQFKEPFSLESATSARWINFVERSVGITNLQPAEDLGLMIFGKLFNKHVEYGIGIFNGMATNIAEASDDKDVAGRVVVSPFASSNNKWVKNIHIGGSATYGKQSSTLDGTSFRTAGRTAFLTYVNPTGGNDVTFNSFRTRAGADLAWSIGPFSFQGEYLFTRLSNLTLAASQDQDIHAFALQTTYLLTGEDKPRNKPVTPKHNFSIKNKGWGAWELMARYEQFRTDQSLINNGLATGTDDLWAISGGGTWWPNKHIKIMFNYVHTAFDDALGSIGKHENVFLTRFQFNI